MQAGKLKQQTVKTELHNTSRACLLAREVYGGGAGEKLGCKFIKMQAGKLKQQTEDNAIE